MWECESVSVWGEEYKYVSMWGMKENKYKYVKEEESEYEYKDKYKDVDEGWMNELTFSHHEKNGLSHPSTPPKTD